MVDLRFAITAYSAAPSLSATRFKGARVSLGFRDGLGMRALGLGSVLWPSSKSLTGGARHLQALAPC